MDIMEMITTLGFPAAIAAFALWNSYKHEEFLQGTMETTLKENTSAINELRVLIASLTKGDNEE